MSRWFKFLLQEEPGGVSRQTMLKKGLIFYFKNLLLVIMFLLLLIGALNLLGINTDSLKTTIKMDVEEVQEKGLLFVAFFTILFGPFIEEMAFRLGLSFKKIPIALSVFALVYIYSSLLIGGGYFQHVLLKLLIAGLTACAVFFVPQRFWNKYTEKSKNMVIVLFTLLFACTHMVNYQIVGYLLPLYFLMCLPQLVMGITIVYFRRNMGFFYGLGFHMLMNSFSLLLMLPKYNAVL